MTADELRELEADERGMRMRTGRRELYELRVKHAVGQVENTSEIAKVRHDIARIMTVLRERDFGLLPTAVEDVEQVSSPLAGEVAAVAAGGGSQEPATVEEAPKPKRRTRAKKEDAT